jgi:hypothetical protein
MIDYQLLSHLDVVEILEMGHKVHRTRLITDVLHHERVGPSNELILDRFSDQTDVAFTISNGPKRLLTCLCPFHHERTPSFKMGITGRYHCFGCGSVGTWAELILRVFNPVDVSHLVSLMNQYVKPRHGADQLEFDLQ